MHHKFLSSVALLAIVSAASASVPLAPTSALARVEAQQGFCRNAASLPDIGQASNLRGGHDRRTLEGDRGGDEYIDHGEVVYAAPPPPAPPAPPPPPASARDGGDEEGAIMVTGSRRTESIMDSPTPVTVVSRDAVAEPRGGESGTGDRALPGAVPPRPYPRPQPQSGLLTAGEHDDLLNPELYAAYVRKSNLAQRIPDLPRVDTLNIVTVKVADARGQAVPFAEVKVTCSDGNSISMATQADGTATFFPGLDRLSERISVSARRDGRIIAPARAVLVSEQPGGQLVGLTATDSAQRVDKLDLMFVIDTTGSMGDEIRYLQSELKTIINYVAAKHRGVDIRLGFVFYRDEGDAYITHSVDFASDIERQQGVLAKQQALGGGDYPEAMDEGLIHAVSQQWRPDAVKSLFLVADAPPHDDKFGRTWTATEAARAKRIHITPIAASGVADEAEYAMRAMAAATQSRYLFLTDDSGIGNPHAPPAIDCYLVTRLDALVRRVVDSQLSGRRVEPGKDEVIRSVGNYDAGKCILPRGYRWDQG